MVDFLNFVKYAVVFIIGYVIGSALNAGTLADVMIGLALVIAVKAYEIMRYSSGVKLQSHVHVYRR